MNNSKQRQYNELKIEDFIWIIYFFIITAQLYSNYLQEKNVTGEKYTSKKEISKLNLTILIIVFFIYLYFVYLAYNHLKNSKTEKDKYLTSLTFYASILFLIAGAIFIYVEYKSNFDIEEVGII